MALQGIDVSNWKDVDVACAPDFVVVQTTWGVGGFDNVNLANGVSTIADRQYQRAKEAGKRRGFMHYCMGNNPDAEAAFFAANNRGYFGDGIPMVDWEKDDNPLWQDAGAFDRQLAAFERVLGGPGIAYFMQSQYDLLKPVCDAHNWGAWVAQYADLDPTGIQETPWNEGAYDCAMRQYSSNGQLGNGIALDLDKFYGDENAWDAYVAGSVGGGPVTTPAPAPAPAPSPTPTATTYVVQPGDTLSAIAARYGVPMSAITGYSSGDPNLIRVGETLTIGGAGKAVYTVQPGDTLSAIAQKVGWGGNYQGLAQLNHIADPDLIHPGDTINY
jgi:lysozyme